MALNRNGTFERYHAAKVLADLYASEQRTHFYEHLLSLGFMKQGVSPIEALLGCALYYTLERDRIHANCPDGVGFMNGDYDLEKAKTCCPFDGILCFHQSKIGPYTADFLFRVNDEEDGMIMVAVECDGHDFHERTKQQASHDKKRDRYFQQHGVRVLRYTGSDIWKDPFAVAEEVVTACNEMLRLAAKERR